MQGECSRGPPNPSSSFHCSSLAKVFSRQWGQSQASIWYHSGRSWSCWGSRWHRSRWHGTSAVYSHSASHVHLAHPYRLLILIIPVCVRSVLFAFSSLHHSLPHKLQRHCHMHHRNQVRTQANVHRALSLRMVPFYPMCYPGMS